CPACDARTCSLVGSKRHKVYNQCNGVRDPAKYLRRSELYTETALNRDYNFLTNLERAIDGSTPTVNSSSTERKSVDDQEDDTAEPVKPQNEKMRWQALEKAFESRGILVKKAPAGLKRARENNTALVL